jgi:hypothetical protein
MINVALALRPGVNSTNFRAAAVAGALDKAGCHITVIDRSMRLPVGTDLFIQTAFSGSNPLREATSEGIPYIIAECAFLRHFPGHSIEKWVSWGYNGLCGGSFAPKAPNEEIWKPELGIMREFGDGPTVIIGQTPNDHSIRGGDHYAWLREVLEQYPDAEFRPHPNTVIRANEEPLESLYKRAGHIVTYNSTSGAEALYSGCPMTSEHFGSMAFEVTDREAWAHELSWRHFPIDEYNQRVGKHILSGFEEARSRAMAGLHEIPREKRPMSPQYSADMVERMRQ